MTVGYGDVTPIGIGKPIALFEAMIGYLLLQHFCTSSSVSRHDATYFPGNFPGSLEVCRTDDEAAVNDINICHCQKTSVIL